MKNIKLLFLAGALAVPASAQQENRRITPYFNMGLSENLFIQESGDFFSGAQIKTNVGAVANVTQSGNHAVFGMYTLDYDGPGFEPQDTTEWRYRSMSHVFNLEYRFKFAERFRIRPGYIRSITYTRTGANEIWGEGLYDSNTKGYSAALDYSFAKGGVTLSYSKRDIEFPNYTDLLREFQNAGNSAETSGGLQDQGITELGLSAYWKKLFAGVTSSAQDYDNQQVVESNGVYGTDLQKDKVQSAYAGFHGKLWRFEIEPSARYAKRDSNQNFMRYKSFGDTSPVFVENNYDYTEYGLNVPFYFNLTRAGTALNFGYTLTRRSYADRPARDENNDYGTEKQWNMLNQLTFGIRKSLNELAFMKLTYSIFNGSSNNKFEKYIPYNFTGQAVGMAFEVKY